MPLLRDPSMLTRLEKNLSATFERLSELSCFSTFIFSLCSCRGDAEAAGISSRKHNLLKCIRVLQRPSLPPLHQCSFSGNTVIKAAPPLIQLWSGGGGGAPRAWNCESRQSPGEHITLAGFEMKRTSRQLCNMCSIREDGQREGGGGSGRRADPCAC